MESFNAVASHVRTADIVDAVRRFISAATDRSALNSDG
jgi:hypothetical protein